LNSAELPAPLQYSSDPSRWDDVRRIYRRVCVLRAKGARDDAAELENTELARVLAAARLSELSPDEEALIFRQEADRVANASVLAELLAPLLAEELGAHARLAPAASASSPTPVTPKPANVPRPASAKPPSITDLLDGMLSQETTFNPSPIHP
jgi:hypothetical protein